MIKKVIFCISILAVFSISIHLYNAFQYQSIINKVEAAVQKEDIKQLEKLFVDTEKVKIENFNTWAKNNPDEFNKQVDLVNYFAGKYNGDFSGKNLQPTKLAYIQEEPIIVLKKTGIFKYNVEFIPQVISFFLINGEVEDYSIKINNKLVKLEDTKRDDIFILKLIPDQYNISIYKSQNTQIFNSEFYAGSNNNSVSFVLK